MKAKLTILPGLSEQEVWERRARHYLSMSPEEKFHRFCTMNQIALMTGKNKARQNAKVTLRSKNGPV